jgi:lipoate---protein ligase
LLRIFKLNIIKDEKSFFKMNLKIIDSGSQKASDNMQTDAVLLADLPKSKDPILHLYDWSSPTVTYGLFQDPALYFNMDKAAKANLQFAKRPTGGGILFHIWDYAFSFLLPKEDPHFSKVPIENYRYVHQIVARAIGNAFGLQPLEMIPDDAKATVQSSKNFCMARPTKYDLLYKGKKIAGAAQRKTKDGFLHQGTIALAPSDPNYIKLLQASDLKRAMLENSCSIVSKENYLSAKQLMKKALIEEFSKEFVSLVQLHDNQI